MSTALTGPCDAALGRGGRGFGVGGTGSTDGTKAELRKLQAMLVDAGVRHIIVSEDTPKARGPRIPYLAGVRNQALRPLLDNPATANGTYYDKLLFFNDIVFIVRGSHPAHPWPLPRAEAPEDAGLHAQRPECPCA